MVGRALAVGTVPRRPKFSPLAAAFAVVSVLLLLPTVGGERHVGDGLPVTSGDGAAERALTPRADLPLSITNFSAAPASISLGQLTYLKVTVVGGNPPYNFTYTGLPFGCVSRNTSSDLCSPTVASRFVVQVTVNDSSGASASSTTPLVVTAGYGVLSVDSIDYVLK